MSRIKPARVRQLVFGFYMSGMMSVLMSGVITFVNTGVDSEYFSRWGAGFLVAWAVAFPLITFIAPIAVKLTEVTLGRLYKDDKPTSAN
ncbi:DUF2798 domain-containing protein [Marinobacter sp. ANT_B65]|uniref:DUF2798 domain-containing protein n=1 Tax=Marinobacter sp. ANT_B65 TaxID=2039467 RepID=UPI000BBF0948|nr:DUF2798 domain-containing protein [Marinobacter sp. ANT_B65]PCM43631.1 hypothetical protein CPA50_14775 [Marinobacter sp. ANT_B65]